MVSEYDVPIGMTRPEPRKNLIMILTELELKVIIIAVRSRRMQAQPKAVRRDVVESTADAEE